MAKGDDARTRNLIKYEGDTAGNLINNTREGVLTPQYTQARNSWVDAIGEQNQERSGLKSGYQNFADTGGYSKDDLANIRERSISPLRSVYANANREVDRSRALSGGYSPGFGVLKARMAREQGQAISDANTNVNADIAQMFNQGKKFGLSGGSSLYSASPGLVNTYGNQMLTASGQLQDQDKLSLARSLGLIDAQNSLNQAPGKFQSTMGNIGSVFDTVGKIGTAAGSF